MRDLILRSVRIIISDFKAHKQDHLRQGAVRHCAQVGASLALSLFESNFRDLQYLIIYLNCMDKLIRLGQHD